MNIIILEKTIPETRITAFFFLVTLIINTVILIKTIANRYFDMTYSFILNTLFFIKYVMSVNYTSKN